MWTTEQVKDYAADQLGSGNRIDMRDIEKLLPKGWEIEDWELVSDKNDSPGWYPRNIRMDLITMLPSSQFARPVFRAFLRQHWCWSGQFDIDLISKMDHFMVHVKHRSGRTMCDILPEFPT